jgi:agarase
VKRGSIAVLALLTSTMAVGASSQSPVSSSAATQDMIFDFEDGIVPASLQAANAQVSIAKTAEGHALRADLQSRENLYTSLTFRPATPWDWRGGDVVGLALEIRNPGGESVQLNLDIVDGAGRAATRSTVIPARGGGTYYAPLKGPDLKADTGLRDDPDYWRGVGRKFTWMWGSKELDLAGIREFKIGSISLASDRSITIDQVRIIRNPSTDPSYLKGIVDRYGQAAKIDFVGKVKSDAQLQAARHCLTARATAAGKMDPSSRQPVSSAPKRSTENGRWSIPRDISTSPPVSTIFAWPI